MSIEQQKNQIKEKISQIEKYEISKLYPSGPNAAFWGNLSNSECEKFVNSTIKSLKELKSNTEILDSVSFNYIQNIDTYLTGIMQQWPSLQNIDINQITTHHHAVLNQINALNQTLRMTGIYTELKFQPKLKEKLGLLTAIEPLGEKLINKSADITSAIETATKWLKTKGEIDEQTIKGQADAFLRRAQEHKIGGKKIMIFKWNIFGLKTANIWLVSALFFSIIVGLITAWFVKEAGSNLSPGQAILKIATILVPAYLTVFSANQYLYHKKMYEAYMFKFASLHTMNNLMSTKAEPMQEKILAKGLDVLFSEPTSKDDGSKQDKQIIGELLGMLKSQIK